MSFSIKDELDEIGGRLSNEEARELIEAELAKRGFG